MSSLILSKLKSRKLLLVLFDLICFCVIDAIYLYCLYLFGEISDNTLPSFLYSSLILVVLIFIIRIIFGIYTNIWRYTNTKAFLFLVICDACATIATAVISTVAFDDHHLLWHLASIAAFNALATLSSRFVYRLIYKRTNSSVLDDEHDHKINVAIIGAGQIGALLAEELLYGKNTHYKPICFIDSDISKKGSKVNGLKVLHEDENVIDELKRLPVQELFIALTGLDSDMAAKLYDFYSRTGCKIKIYDTPIKELGEVDSVSKRSLREFQIEDLLFRKPIVINNSEVLSSYSGKTVMITGGGGSIGSELCRQIAKCSLKKLVIVDIYENNAYEIQQELIRTYGDRLDLSVEIASVRDRDRLDSIFAMYKPDIVFHAAAHKHVPLMERSGCEAIKNNVMGTYNTADMAEKYGVSKFILVSTDKAVNPTNIMGASKRLCEMVVQCRTDSKTSFAAVRFGNVLGSNGSVIPLFKHQIQNGGPITITDKRIIRYFMTIPEASQLVIQAGSMAKSGELFVLDMGRPVKIYDLAVNMIRLSGLRPEIDIKIEEIGLRPGEKLFEELLMKSETLDKTDNNMIFIEKDTPYTRAEVEEKLSILRAAVVESKHTSGSEKIKEAIRKTVPTYHDPEEINKTAELSSEMKNVR